VTPKELERIEQRFIAEHEKEAAGGWPGAWADRPVMRGVVKHLSRQQREALYAEGVLGFSQYLVDTAPRYARFQVEAEEGNRDQAWASFLDDTRAQRQKFQLHVLAKLVAITS
jgi:hypothetical protein